MSVLPRLAAAAVVISAGFLAACSLDDPRNRFAQLTYDHLPDINLDVGEIQIEQAYVTPGQAPNVDHLFPVQPKDAAVRWAQDRLVARGDRLSVRYIVREAAATETPLPTSGGLTGMLKTEQSERYELHLLVEMQVLDGRQVHGTARAEARRSVTVAENSSLAEREQVWYRLTEDTMRDLDQQLEKTIREAFFPYIML